MPRLIDATRIEQYILNYCSDNEEINAIYAEIINAPTVEAEPVRHGHWIDRGYMKVGYHCSLCGGYVIAGKEKYCPNCGAKMDGEGSR